MQPWQLAAPSVSPPSILRAMPTFQMSRSQGRGKNSQEGNASGTEEMNSLERSGAQTQACGKLSLR